MTSFRPERLTGTPFYVYTIQAGDQQVAAVVNYLVTAVSPRSCMSSRIACCRRIRRCPSATRTHKVALQRHGTYVNGPPATAGEELGKGQLPSLACGR